MPVLLASIGLTILMAAAWAIHRTTRNAGWIDAIWTFGVGLCACLAAIYPAGTVITERQWLVASLAALWSVRLGLHIAARNLRRSDDPRYATMAAEWGIRADRKFFWFLQQQAWCGAILILSISVAAQRPGAALTVQDLCGAAVLVFAVLGEALADAQLRGFAARQRIDRAVCDVGLWRYSRHPNYFFEWLVWLAFPIIAIDLGGTYAWGWLGVSGPVLMYWLLVHVSGIPPLEAQMIASRGAAYERYRARTHAFFPWVPRDDSEA